MKRVLVFALILTLSGTLGFGASFFATTKSLRNHAFLGTLAGIPLPETCYPSMALYLETYMIDEIAVLNGGVGCIANTESFDVAGALGVLNAFPVAITWADVSTPNLEIFGKAAFGSLTCCCCPCSIWDVDLVAALQTDILINLWLKNVFLPEICYERMDISFGCANASCMFGLDIERINSNKLTHLYFGTLLKFTNMTLVPKVYFALCDVGFGINLFGEF